MNKLPDIAEFFTPERALEEEINWLLNRAWEEPLNFIVRRLTNPKINRIIEFGCKSGLLVAHLLPMLKEFPEFEYRGLDTNDWFLQKARNRTKSGNSERVFFQNFDPRNFTSAEPSYDLAMAWSFFKHYSEEELPLLMKRLLDAGRCAAFNFQVMLDKNGVYDNGDQYHHTYVERPVIDAMIDASNHKIVEAKEMRTWTVDLIGRVADVLFWTERQTKGEPHRPRIISADLLEEGQAIHKPIEASAQWQPQFKVGGEDVSISELHLYSLRWSAVGASLPVLYKEGRRVTKEWSLSLDATRPEQPDEANANTAE